MAFMNECRTFKIIIKPCRVADDLMAPIRAAFRYKEQLERAAGQEQEQETAYSMTEQAYLEHRRMWLMRASNNKRAQDVLAELMKVNLSFSDMEAETKGTPRTLVCLDCIRIHQLCFVRDWRV